MKALWIWLFTSAAWFAFFRRTPACRDLPTASLLLVSFVPGAPWLLLARTFLIRAHARRRLRRCMSRAVAKAAP